MLPLCTVCVNTKLVLGKKLASPGYCAVILCDPALNVEVLNVAVPPDSVPVPSVWVPSRNVIVPVAVDGVTVAVNVTC